MSTTDGILKAIAIKPAKGVPMQKVDRVDIGVGVGLEGNAISKDHRQVTLLSVEDWCQACQELGADIDWTLRRANLLVEGLQFKETTNATIRIGDVVMKVTQETAPCTLMDEQHTGLLKALLPNWRAGVCTTVEAGGEIRVGDKVTLSN